MQANLNMFSILIDKREDVNKKNELIFEYVEFLNKMNVPIFKDSHLRGIGNYYFFNDCHEKSVHYYEMTYPAIMATNLLVYPADTNYALALAKLIPNSAWLKKWRYKRRYKELMKNVKWAAEQCPGNYLHLYLLILGSYQELNQNYQEAIQTYNQAIKQAKNGYYYLYIALANELAGNLHIELKDPRAEEK